MSPEELADSMINESCDPKFTIVATPVATAPALVYVEMVEAYFCVRHLKEEDSWPGDPVLILSRDAAEHLIEQLQARILDPKNCVYKNVHLIDFGNENPAAVFAVRKINTEENS